MAEMKYTVKHIDPETCCPLFIEIISAVSEDDAREIAAGEYFDSGDEPPELEVSLATESDLSKWPEVQYEEE